MIPSLGISLSSLSLSLSFSRQAPSHIPTSLSPFNFYEKSHRFWVVVLLDTLKYSYKSVAMVQYGIITYIKCFDTADYYPECGRRSDGCTSTITHDLKSIVTRLTNKAVSPGQMDSPTNDKNCSYRRCTIENFKK